MKKPEVKGPSKTIINPFNKTDLNWEKHLEKGIETNDNIVQINKIKRKSCIKSVKSSSRSKSKTDEKPIIINLLNDQDQDDISFMRLFDSTIKKNIENPEIQSIKNYKSIEKIQYNDNPSNDIWKDLEFDEELINKLFETTDKKKGQKRSFPEDSNDKKTEKMLKYY